MDYLRVVFSGALLLAAGAGLAGCAPATRQPAAGKPATITAAPSGDQVEITVESQPEATVIDIRDPSGIGSADFNIGEGAFPGRLVFRLYLKGLEQVRLAYGGTAVEASLSSRPGAPVMQSLSPGGEPLEPGGPYWLGIEIVPQDGAAAQVPLESGYFQVEVPPDFYKQQPESWSLSWVDFYR